MTGMTTGRAGYAKYQYWAGKMLIDPSIRFLGSTTKRGNEDNASLQDGPIARLERPFLAPTSVLEKQGQVAKVVFVKGLVQFS